MRAALPLILVAAATLLAAASPAIADVGPTPRCKDGTHHEYLYGHHCVADGSHLEEDPNGGSKTVSNNAPAVDAGVAAPTPSASASADPPPAPTATAASVAFVPQTESGAGAPPSEPPPRRGCACDIAGAGGSGDWVVAAAGVAAALVRRRPAR